MNTYYVTHTLDLRLTHAIKAHSEDEARAQAARRTEMQKKLLGRTGEIQFGLVSDESVSLVKPA